VDGKTAATGHIERPLPFRLSLDETLDCGEDTGTLVTADYRMPFKFTGALKKVRVDLKPAPLTAQDRRRLDAGKAAAAVAAQ
jgi:arylsulfatase